MEDNPIRYTLRIKSQVRQIIKHLREDVGKVTEAKAHALFETSAKVLIGLVQPFDEYEKKTKVAGELRP